MEYELIDNFLDDENFDKLVTLITDKEKSGNLIMPWYFYSSIAMPDDVTDNVFYMAHVFYDSKKKRKTIEVDVHRSHLLDNLIPLFEKLGFPTMNGKIVHGNTDKELIRAKANLYPNTQTVQEHTMHVDAGPEFTGNYRAAILSLNTCDGYTKMKDGTKIDSIANRVVIFDAREKHCSTTTTNVSARINININYLDRTIPFS